MWTNSSNRYNLIKKYMLPQRETILHPDEYIQHAFQDFSHSLTNAFNITRLTLSTYPQHQINLEIEPSSIFDAFVRFTDEDDVCINISIATFLALDDLFQRSVCNKDFYSFDPELNGRRQWHGCQCLWLNHTHGFRPKNRYYNYAIQQTENPSMYMTALLSAIALDPKRQQIANLMLDISILWILMHEEGHYENGHLLYLQDVIGAHAAKQGIQEAKATDSSFFSASKRKVFEWQADRTATRAAIDVFMHSSLTDRLPSYTSNNQVGWLFRLVIVSIGTAILIMQKARNIDKTADDYPSPQTRLIGVIYIALGWIVTEKVDNASQFSIGVSKLTDPNKQIAKVINIFQGAILGALDDLHTVSELINRDGDITSWVPRKPPTFKKTHNLGLLDTKTESRAIAMLIFQQMLGTEFLIYPSGNVLFDKLKKRWFEELDSIVALHDNDLYKFLEPYRRATGIVYD